MVRVKNWMKIDGHYSQEFGLKMARLPLWPTAAETVENTVIPGVPIEFDRHTGQYKDFDLTLTGYIKNSFDTRKINSWVQNGKQVILSPQPQVYGIIRKVGQIHPTRIGTRAAEIQIPITFQPFKFSCVDIPQVLKTSPAYLHNFGNIFCEPVYTVTIDSGTILADLTINGITLQIAAAALDTGTVVIDIPRKKIYKEAADGTRTIIQEYTVGQFWRAILPPGENVITWDTGISCIKVEMNERWL